MGSRSNRYCQEYFSQEYYVHQDLFLFRATRGLGWQRLSSVDPLARLRKSHFRAHPASINRLQMYLSEVIFEDDTMWVNGYWFRRDPRDPQNWIRIQREGALRGPPGLWDGAAVAGFAKTGLSEI